MSKRLQVLMEEQELLYGSRRVSARDAVHLAIMARHGVREILTFDTGFDALPGVTRLFR